MDKSGLSNVIFHYLNNTSVYKYAEYCCLVLGSFIRDFQTWDLHFFIFVTKNLPISWKIIPCPRKTQFSLDKKKKNFKQKPPSSFVNKFQSLIMPSLSYGWHYRSACLAVCTTFHFVHFNERISISSHTGKFIYRQDFLIIKRHAHRMRLLMSCTHWHTGTPPTISKGSKGCTHINPHILRPIGHPTDTTTTSAQLPGLVGWLKLIYCFKCNLHKNQTISSAESGGERNAFYFVSCKYSVLTPKSDQGVCNHLKNNNNFYQHTFVLTMLLLTQFPYKSYNVKPRWR